MTLSHSTACHDRWLGLGLAVVATRIGVDVGGTFTDFVVFDEASGGLSQFKLPSDPLAPTAPLGVGLSQILANLRSPSQVGSLVHGSTVALNALLQRSGARVGLIVTRGFRDVLQLRRLRLPGAPGFNVLQPKPLVPRRDVREVGGRLLADGREVRPLDLEEVVAEARDLLASGCDVLALCLIHAYRSDRHEAAAAAAIRAAIPGVELSVSSEVWPQQREYERTQVTVINAHVAPVMESYLKRLADDLSALGIVAPVLSTKSSGGIMSSAAAARRPVETLLSGPASGVVAAAELGRRSGFDRLVAFDMGGTSADVGLVETGQVRITTEATVGDFPVILPSVDVSSIGAGGGSIALVDTSGVLKVGPRSAGASPGPVCYGRGGTEPTVTDAYATLGVLTDLLGGSMKLDVEAARASLAGLGVRLGLTPEDAAEAVLEVATANMYSRLLPLMAQRGADPREFALLAYGGAGPTHAFRLASEIGFRSIVVPAEPGTFCALGCLLTDLRADFVATLYASLDAISEADLLAAFERLAGKARVWLQEQAVPEGAAPVVEFSADMRHAGQSYEVLVELGRDLGPNLARRVREAFFAAHQRVYGFADRSAQVEVVNIRSRIIAEGPKPVVLAPARPSPRTHRSRRVRHAGRDLLALEVERVALAQGDRVDGPAVITQYGSTTFVPPRAFVEVDRAGSLIGAFERG